MLAPHDRRFQLRELVLTTGQRSLGFLYLELTRAQRGLAFRNRTLPRGERVEPLPGLRLAVREQLVRVGAIRLRWALGPAEAQTASFVTARIDLL